MASSTLCGNHPDTAARSVRANQPSPLARYGLQTQRRDPHPRSQTRHARRPPSSDAAGHCRGWPVRHPQGPVVVGGDGAPQLAKELNGFGPVLVGRGAPSTVRRAAGSGPRSAGSWRRGRWDPRRWTPTSPTNSTSTPAAAAGCAAASTALMPTTRRSIRTNARMLAILCQVAGTSRRMRQLHGTTNQMRQMTGAGGAVSGHPGRYPQQRRQPHRLG